MKRFTNLPANMRAFFGFLRVVTIVTGFLMIPAIIVNLTILPHYGMDSIAGMTMGDVTLRADPAVLELTTPGAKPGALVLKTVRAGLLAKPGSGDGALRAVILKSTVPYMLVTIVTAYLLFTALRKLCGNWEVGDMFSEENFGLVRRIGLTLVISSLVKAALAVWTAAVVGGFLSRHVTIGGGLKAFDFAGITAFEAPSSLLSIPAGLIIGCLVLMLAAAFRQGLNLKTENDLTV
jgi:hypothetical protein